MKSLESRLPPLLFLPCFALAQAPEVAPTALEAFVSDPAVVVARERLLGRFGGLESATEIYALEAEDRSNPGSVVRGVRIDLATNAWSTSVFLDQDQLSQLSWDLNSIASDQEVLEDSPDPLLGIGRRGRGTGD